MSKIANVVRNLVEEEIEKMNIDVVSVEFTKEGSTRYLRIYIDKRGGVTLDDCEAVSLKVGPMIDELDPISGSYTFEVSSPGLDRPLKTEKDFLRYEGELVEVRLYEQLDGKKAYEGNLIGLFNDKIKIVDDVGIEREFKVESVSIVKRVIKFN